MALQQGLDAPQQLQDIFDVSDALWEAERVLQVVLERVGRHVERLVHCELENSAAVQSCFALILAAGHPELGSLQTSNSLPSGHGEEEAPTLKAQRYTRGGIPIRTEADQQDDPEPETTLLMQPSNAAYASRLSRSAHQTIQAQSVDFQVKITPLLVQQPSYEHYERLREEIEKRRRQAQKKAEKVAKEAKERSDIEKLHQDLHNQQYTYDSSGKIVVLAGPESSPRAQSELQLRVIPAESPPRVFQNMQGTDNENAKLNAPLELDFIPEKPFGQAAVYETIKLAPGCTVKQGQSSKKGQASLDPSERLTRKAFRRLQHASQSE